MNERLRIAALNRIVDIILPPVAMICDAPLVAAFGHIEPSISGHCLLVKRPSSGLSRREKVSCPGQVLDACNKTNLMAIAPFSLLQWPNR